MPMLENYSSGREADRKDGWQYSLIRRAELSGIHLEDLLIEQRRSYDDLRYLKCSERRWAGPKPLSLNELKQGADGPELVSFFTGSGGMDLGFEAAGFQHVCALENNQIFCDTLRHNRPNWQIIGPPSHNGDVSQVDDVIQVLSDLISRPFDGVFVGGPPCQPFSIAANQRFSREGNNFKRVGFHHKLNGGLLFDYVNLILEFRPAAFVIENVPGLRDIDGGDQLLTVLNILKREGYDTGEPILLNSADFRVPQQRLRLFIIGLRNGRRLALPMPNGMQIGCGSVLPTFSPKFSNNETRKHSAPSIHRYMQLDYGARDKLGRVDRLDPTLPAKTVIAGGSRGGGRSHLHPEIPRTLSVRECARLQSFPDTYEFLGPMGRQFTQVGNAVPPVLAAQLALSLRNALD